MTLSRDRSTGRMGSQCIIKQWASSPSLSIVPGLLLSNPARELHFHIFMNVRDLILKITFVFFSRILDLCLWFRRVDLPSQVTVSACDPQSRESNFARPGASGGKKQPPEKRARQRGARGGEVSAATLTRSESSVRRAEGKVAVCAPRSTSRCWKEPWLRDKPPRPPPPG